MTQQERLRSGVREWLKMLERKYNMKPRQIATRADVAPSTVYRALEEDGQYVMSTTTISQIAAAFGEEVPDVGQERADEIRSWIDIIWFFLFLSLAAGQLSAL